MKMVSSNEDFELYWKRRFFANLFLPSLLCPLVFLPLIFGQHLPFIFLSWPCSSSTDPLVFLLRNQPFNVQSLNWPLVQESFLDRITLDLFPFLQKFVRRPSFAELNCSLQSHNCLLIFEHAWIQWLQMLQVYVVWAMSFFDVLLQIVLTPWLEPTYWTEERSSLQMRFHMPLQMVLLVCFVIARGATKVVEALVTFLTQIRLWDSSEFPKKKYFFTNCESNSNWSQPCADGTRKV